jgi:hypothetical protein
VGKLGEHGGSSIVWHFDDVAASCMDLQSFRELADRLLEKPTIESAGVASWMMIEQKRATK